MPIHLAVPRSVRMWPALSVFLRAGLTCTVAPYVLGLIRSVYCGGAMILRVSDSAIFLDDVPT